MPWFVTKEICPNAFAARTSAIHYRRWSVAGGWSNPVAVLRSPVGVLAREPVSFLDPSNVMHVTFFGGNEQGAAACTTRRHPRSVRCNAKTGDHGAFILPNG